MKKERTKEIERLLQWVTKGVDLKRISKINYPPKHFPKRKYGVICSDEDTKAPFFSEAYLYNLLGKEDARTLLALMCQALESVGIELTCEDL